MEGLNKIYMKQMTWQGVEDWLKLFMQHSWLSEYYVAHRFPLLLPWLYMQYFVIEVSCDDSFAFLLYNFSVTAIYRPMKNLFLGDIMSGNMT